MNDLFALTLAKSLGCPLVTGDRRLRAAAEAEGLQLLGTLTLMEHLFVHADLDELLALRFDRLRQRFRAWRLPRVRGLGPFLPCARPQALDHAVKFSLE